MTIYNYTSPKTFLIPQDYEGPIRIVYEESCGDKPIKENGRQILVIPKNGIIILNQKFDGGINNEYYLVDNKGNRTKANQILNFKDRKTKLPAVLIGSSGRMVDDQIIFSDFYFYNKDTTEEDYKEFQKFDSLTINSVKSCRQNAHNSP